MKVNYLQLSGVPETDEHLARRFGMAVVTLWHEFSPNDQADILEQAFVVSDKESPTAELREQLQGFIKEHNLVERAKR